MSPSAGRGSIVVRRLEPRDLVAALAIQAECYPPALRETREAFASLLTLPTSCCLAVDEGGVLIAYLLAHGWAKEQPPPVGAVLSPTGEGEVLFIHDLSVTAAARGGEIGRRLVDRAFDLARAHGLAEAELIAVRGAASYWRTLGFVETPLGPGLAAKVAAYGAEARWMTRPIA